MYRYAFVFSLTKERCGCSLCDRRSVRSVDFVLRFAIDMCEEESSSLGTVQSFRCDDGASVVEGSRGEFRCPNEPHVVGTNDRCFSSSRSLVESRSIASGFIVGGGLLDERLFVPPATIASVADDESRETVVSRSEECDDTCVGSNDPYAMQLVTMRSVVYAFDVTSLGVERLYRFDEFCAFRGVDVRDATVSSYVDVIFARKIAIDETWLRRCGYTGRYNNMNTNFKRLLVRNQRIRFNFKMALSKNGNGNPRRYPVLSLDDFRALLVQMRHDRAEQVRQLLALIEALRVKYLEYSVYFYSRSFVSSARFEPATTFSDTVAVTAATPTAITTATRNAMVSSVVERELVEELSTTDGERSAIPRPKKSRTPSSLFSSSSNDPFQVVAADDCLDLRVRRVVDSNVVVDDGTVASTVSAVVGTATDTTTTTSTVHQIVSPDVSPLRYSNSHFVHARGSLVVPSVIPPIVSRASSGTAVVSPNLSIVDPFTRNVHMFSLLRFELTDRSMFADSLYDRCGECSTATNSIDSSRYAGDSTTGLVGTIDEYRDDFFGSSDLEERTHDGDDDVVSFARTAVSESSADGGSVGSNVDLVGCGSFGVAWYCMRRRSSSFDGRFRWLRKRWPSVRVLCSYYCCSSRSVNVVYMYKDCVKRSFPGVPMVIRGNVIAVSAETISALDPVRDYVPTDSTMVKIARDLLLAMGGIVVVDDRGFPSLSS